MAFNTFTSNQGTQTALLTDNTGGTGGTLIPVMKIDTSAQGTAGSLWNGNIGLSSGTISAGTINLGTVVGKDANAAAQTGNPVGVGGTDSGGTIRTWKVDANGLGHILVESGTISSLPNLPGGSVAITAGTVNAGTINAATVSTGSIVVTAGTISTGTINLGTVVGKDANAAAQTGNPLSIGGTDSGGTVRTILVDASGRTNIGTISVLPNLPQGSINVTAGTINTGTINAATITAGSIVVTAGTVTTGTINLGTVVGKDANAVAQTGNPLSIGGTDSGGTIRTIKVDSGGLVRIGLDSGTLSVLPNLPQGSINVTAGTMTAGTINTGTINAGTINTGTVNVGTINTGTINTGTFRADARTTQNIVAFGTQIANSVAAVATIVGSASVGAGTSLWVQDVSIINPFANATCILGFGTTQQGTNVLFRGVLGTAAAAGIEKSFAKAVNAGMTNQDLVFSMTGAGTVDLSLSYFISA